MKTNAELLSKAEDLSSNLKFELKCFYEENVTIRNEYIELNNAKKIPYEQLVEIDSEAAKNGFEMLVRDLEDLSKFINDFYDGDVEVFKSDDHNIEMFEKTMKLIGFAFEHICKWHGNNDSKLDK